MNQEPTRECKKLCGFPFTGHAKDCPNAICHSIKPPVEEVIEDWNKQAEDLHNGVPDSNDWVEEWRKHERENNRPVFDNQFDWIKSQKEKWEKEAKLELVADQKAGKIPYYNMVLREVRVEAFNSGRASMVEEAEKVIKDKKIVMFDVSSTAEEVAKFANKQMDDILQALKNKETKE